MLEDRHYMRQESSGFGPWTSSPTLVLLAINLAVFILQSVSRVYFQSTWELDLALSGKGLLRGYVWQLFTFQFLHLDFWHFFLNGFALYMFGKPVEMSLGNARFWEIYFASGVGGGLCQAVLGLVFPAYFGAPTLGASAGVAGLLAAFCLIYRNATIRLFFILPIRAWNFLIGAMALALFFVLVPSEPGIAHAAHLGGMLTAIGYFQWFVRRERRLLNWRPYSAASPARPWRRGKTAIRGRTAWRLSASQSEPELTPGEFISQEVDPILDKISAHGFQSLTAQEKEILRKATSKMRGR